MEGLDVAAGGIPLHEDDTVANAGLLSDGIVLAPVAASQAATAKKQRSRLFTGKAKAKSRERTLTWTLDGHVVTLKVTPEETVYSLRQRLNVSERP